MHTCDCLIEDSLLLPVGCCWKLCRYASLLSVAVCVTCQCRVWALIQIRTWMRQCVATMFFVRSREDDMQCEVGYVVVVDWDVESCVMCLIGYLT